VNPAVAADEGLRRRFKRWMEVVRLARKGPQAVYSISATEYHDLHTELLQLCAARAHQHLAPDQRAFFAELVVLLEPWVNRKSLAEADRDDLASLWASCREVEQALGGASADKRWSARRLALWGGALLVVVAAGGALWWGGVTPQDALWAVRGWFYEAIRPITGLPTYKRLLLFGGVLVLATIVAIWRSARLTS
jgi:hypothetical protein